MRGHWSEAGLASELHAQAVRARRRARVMVSRSLVLAGVRDALDRAEDALVRRCAWCNRYELGGVWTPARRLPRFVAGDGTSVGGKEVTHTICPTCFERSLREGRARERA